MAALQRCEAVQIYPEGRSHSEPSLTPLKTGAVRIALRAEAGAGWSPGLRVVPVGLTYERKHRFRGRVVATVGEPLTLALGAFRALHDKAPHRAVRTLTGELAERLAEVTLNTDAVADRELVETAEALYAREKGEGAPRDRRPLSDRIERLQAFASFP